MGISSYAVGLVPLSFPLSPHKIRAISVLGSGILVGTAIIVIIPEGVSMLYSIPGIEDSAETQHSHDTAEKRSLPYYPSSYQSASSNIENDPIHLFARHGGDGDHTGKRGQVGLSLIMGFLFMYLIDKMPLLIAAFSQLFHSLPFSSSSSRGSSFAPLASIDMSSFRNSIIGGITSRTSPGNSNSPNNPNTPLSSNPVTPSSLENGTADLPRISVGARPSGNPPYSHHHRTDSLLSPTGEDPSDPTMQATKPKSTAFGLVIHAVADGIALGASIASGDSSIEAIVFLAIMIHKAPASFGLAAVVLQAEGVQQAKRTLGMFAAAAPFGALLTYAIISFLGESDGVLIQWWTGILLLFSGGTFLYVAVHVMQELDNNGSHGASATGELDGLHGGPATPYNSVNSDATGGADALLGIIGMLLPVLTLFVPE